MSDHNEALAEFELNFNRFPKAEFNPQWHNGTGYFDGAAQDASIKEACSAVDEHGRRMIILPNSINGTVMNIVLFERATSPNAPLIIHHPTCKWSRTDGGGVKWFSTSHLASNDAVQVFVNMLYQF